MLEALRNPSVTSRSILEAAFILTMTRLSYMRGPPAHLLDSMRIRFQRTFHTTLGTVHSSTSHG
jgi:hypothetical protein